MANDEPVVATDGEPEAEAPWGFRILVVGFVLYLAYRAVQAVIWLVHNVG